MTSTGLKVKHTKRAKRMARRSDPVQSFGSMKFTLNNGVQMPAVGIGTFRIRKGDDIMKVVEYALDAGYRLFDTAAVYNNETHLKQAFRVLLPKYGLERDDIFVTTKLCNKNFYSPSDNGGPDVICKAYEKSLENLGLDHVDLYLVHFPKVVRLNVSDAKNQKIRENTWACLEELYDNGRVNAIGVSNFTIQHLDEIANNHSVMPTVNQVEWHPFYHQPELLKYCKEKDIVVQAYCSFGGTSSSNPELLEHPVVKKIAKKLDVTCAQVLLVWALQQDVAVIPKSTSPERIKENITLNFRIPDEDIKLLNALGEQNTKYAWDPKAVY